ncbi:MAG TPA: SBBP repeat-containing protein, partial [Pyrinomonadaceae bacterium]
LGDYDRTKPLVIDPKLVYSTFLGGNFGGGYITNIAVDDAGNAYVTGATQAVDFPAENNLQLNLKGEFFEAFVTKINPAGTQLVFSTLLGGNEDAPADPNASPFNGGTDAGGGIAVDSAGSVYVGGTTSSKDFPVTPGALKITCRAAQCLDAFVTKLNPAGNALVYSAILGGNDTDAIRDLVVDSAGNAYVAGETNSVDFPIVKGFQTESPTGAGNINAFAAKLNAAGSALLYSTYAGGTFDDIRRVISVGADAAGNIYLSGSGAVDFPVRGGVDSENAASFIAKFNPALSGDASLVYFTKVPGAFTGGMFVDVQGNAYIMGDGVDPAFITPGALQLHACDLHVAKFNTNITGRASLVYYTPLGGSRCELAGAPLDGGIAVDGAGNAYVFGVTLSDDFPITADAFQKRHSGIVSANPTTSDTFVTKLNASGTAIIYSTYFASTNPVAVAADASGNAYLTGGAVSFTPASPDAVQPSAGNSVASFVAKIDNSATTTTYTVSGRVTDENGNGLSAATVTLTGTQLVTTQTDAGGNYSFTELTPFGEYTLSAVKTGFAFTPYNQTLSNLSQSQTVNFTGKVVATTFTISGQISPGGTLTFPPSSVKVTLSLNGTPVGSQIISGGFGAFAFGNLTPGGNYTVTPSSTNLSFTPASQTFNNLSADRRADFSASERINIYNLIKDFKSLGVTNVTLTITNVQTGERAVVNQAQSKMSALPASVRGLFDEGIEAAEVSCDANSIYAFTNLPPGTYVVKPSSPNYTFQPPSIVFNGGGGPDASNLGGVFIANPLLAYKVGGRIKDQKGAGVDNMRILVCGTRLGKTETDSAGRYEFGTLVAGDDLRLEPSRAEMMFCPGSRSFLKLTQNQVADFDGQPSAANQVDDSRFFVRQHYLDFLNREPDAGGWDYWSSQISQCGANAFCVRDRRVGVSAAYFIELEFQDTGNFVYRMYRASYGRRPAFDEFMPDRAQVVGGSALEASKKSFADAWVQRAAFRQEYPVGWTSEQFVNHLYDKAGLVPYAAERQQQIQAMAAGKTRAQVLQDLIEVRELRDREYNPAFVLMQYFGYLRRDPDEGGYLFWLDVLNNKVPGNYRSMVCAFITSAEYQLRFGSAATHCNAECGP